VPLVRIDVLSTIDDARLDALGDAVHEAMTETIDVPADDLFQIRNTHETPGIRYDPDYLGVHRDDEIVYIAITMRAGRTNDQKQALYKRIAELVDEKARIEPRNVFVTLTENQLIDWSFGDGVPQYAAVSNQCQPGVDMTTRGCHACGHGQTR
jgi:phenylpyruvate tautomerase PptA (4-oxalocrotonate tautomerase family)